MNDFSKRYRRGPWIHEAGQWSILGNGPSRHQEHHNIVVTMVVEWLQAKQRHTKHNAMVECFINGLEVLS